MRGHLLIFRVGGGGGLREGKPPSLLMRSQDLLRARKLRDRTYALVGNNCLKVTEIRHIHTHTHDRQDKTGRKRTNSTHTNLQTCGAPILTQRSARRDGTQIPYRMQWRGND